MLKRTAPERADFPKSAGIDKDLSSSAVLLTKQVDQFQRCAAIEIPFETHVQVSIDLLESYLKTIVHVITSWCMHNQAIPC